MSRDVQASQIRCERVFVGPFERDRFVVRVVGHFGALSIDFAMEVGEGIGRNRTAETTDEIQLVDFTVAFAGKEWFSSLVHFHDNTPAHRQEQD